MIYFAQLVNAANNVYAHESQVNNLRANTPPDQLMNCSPFYVFDGYKYALSDLMKVIAMPENMWDKFRARICTGLVSTYAFGVLVLETDMLFG
jgi:hypothetical protein